jgi:hypothetical protein
MRTLYSNITPVTAKAASQMGRKFMYTVTYQGTPEAAVPLLTLMISMTLDSVGANIVTNYIMILRGIDDRYVT